MTSQRRISDSPHPAERAAGGPRHGAKLTWVVVDGRVVHVSTFADVPPRNRPVARCPECGHAVILKLGRINAHHVAHAPEDVCGATQPETALHINAKYHAAEELRRAAARGLPLVARRACLAGRVRTRGVMERPQDVTWKEWQDAPCPNRDESTWAITWDGVQVEQRLTALESRLVPDILLLRDGTPVAAVEIFVTHRVNDDKARVLASLGVPWLELRAEDVLAPDGVGGAPWNVDHPVPVFREGPAGRWRCPAHQRLFQNWQEERRQEEAEERERGRHTTEVKAIRVVDVMHKSGEHYRRVYRVEERRTDGATQAIALALEEETLLALPFSPEARREIWNRLRAACTRDLERLRVRTGAILDCPMPPGREWVVGAVAEKAWREVDGFLWWRYPLADHYPRRYRRNRAEGTWFIPRDLQGVSWARPADDEFQQHPAAARPQAASGLPTTTLPVQSLSTAANTPVQSSGGVRGRRPESAAGGADERGSRRLRDSDFPCHLDEVICGPSYRLCVLPADETHRETVVGVPEGKVQVQAVRAADAAMARSSLPRVWLSPRGDWTAQLEGLPWAPLSHDAAGEPALPSRVWSGTLDEFLEALRTGAVTVEAIIGWDERARLRF